MPPDITDVVTEPPPTVSVPMPLPPRIIPSELTVTVLAGPGATMPVPRRIPVALIVTLPLPVADPVVLLTLSVPAVIVVAPVYTLADVRFTPVPAVGLLTVKPPPAFPTVVIM